MAKNSEVTRIAPGAEIHGKVSGSEDLFVAGRLEGSLTLEGTVTVEAEGVVKAELHVTRAIVSGIVVGNINATESIQIATGGRVKGDLHAPRISIVEGARFAGAIEMGAVAPRPVEEARTMIERRAPEARRAPPPPPAERPSERPAAAAQPAQPAYVQPAVVSTRPTADQRRKRIVVKKRS